MVDTYSTLRRHCSEQCFSTLTQWRIIFPTWITLEHVSISNYDAMLVTIIAFSFVRFHHSLKQRSQHHSQPRMSIIVPRLSLQTVCVLRLSIAASRAAPRGSRAFHQQTTLTASKTRVRTRVESLNSKLGRKAYAFAGAIRTIFIQTENTPNADVS